MVTIFFILLYYVVSENNNVLRSGRRYVCNDFNSYACGAFKKDGKTYTTTQIEKGLKKLKTIFEESKNIIILKTLKKCNEINKTDFEKEISDFAGTKLTHSTIVKKINHDNYCEIHVRIDTEATAIHSKLKDGVNNREGDISSYYYLNHVKKIYSTGASEKIKKYYKNCRENLSNDKNYTNLIEEIKNYAKNTMSESRHKRLKSFCTYGDENSNQCSNFTDSLIDFDNTFESALLTLRKVRYRKYYSKNNKIDYVLLSTKTLSDYVDNKSKTIDVAKGDCEESINFDVGFNEDVYNLIDDYYKEYTGDDISDKDVTKMASFENKLSKYSSAGKYTAHDLESKKLKYVTVDQLNDKFSTGINWKKFVTKESKINEDSKIGYFCKNSILGVNKAFLETPRYIIKKYFQFLTIFRFYEKFNLDFENSLSKELAEETCTKLMIEQFPNVVSSMYVSTLTRTDRLNYINLIQGKRLIEKALTSVTDENEWMSKRLVKKINEGFSDWLRDFGIPGTDKRLYSFDSSYSDFIPEESFFKSYVTAVTVQSRIYFNDHVLRFMDSSEMKHEILENDIRNTNIGFLRYPFTINLESLTDLHSKWIPSAIKHILKTILKNHRSWTSSSFLPNKREKKLDEFFQKSCKVTIDDNTTRMDMNKKNYHDSESEILAFQVALTVYKNSLVSVTDRYVKNFIMEYANKYCDHQSTNSMRLSIAANNIPKFCQLNLIQLDESFQEAWMCGSDDDEE